jgi:hypothetical protein
MWIDLSDFKYDQDYYQIVEDFVKKKATQDFPTLSAKILKALYNKVRHICTGLKDI